jgi:hypothetical protein
MKCYSDMDVCSTMARYHFLSESKGVSRHQQAIASRWKEFASTSAVQATLPGMRNTNRNRSTILVPDRPYSVHHQLRDRVFVAVAQNETSLHVRWTECW